MTNLPLGEKQIAVMNSATAVHECTRDVLMFHTRIFLSNPPLTKRWAWVGWKSTLVTKSGCLNWCRQCSWDTCHSRT
jgi:hypothetical protein